MKFLPCQVLCDNYFLLLLPATVFAILKYYASALLK